MNTNRLKESRSAAILVEKSHMQRTTRTLFIGAATLMAACASVTKPPAARASLAVGNVYVFRGVPQAENGVLQADMGLSVTDDDGGTFSLTGWGNMNLSDDSGNAIFASANSNADGNGGNFTEIDLVPEYSRSFGKVTTAVGVVNYNFPSGVGTSTSEVYVAASLDTWVNPKLTVYYDVDEIRGLYAVGSVSHRWQLGEKLSLEARLSLGFASLDQGNAYWLDRSSGFADLVASIGLSHALSPHVSLTATAAASTIVDDDYRNALDNDARNIESDNFWFLVGAAWSF